MPASLLTALAVLLALASACVTGPAPGDDRQPFPREPPPPPGPAVRAAVAAHPLPDGTEYRLHRWAFELASTEVSIVDLGLGRDAEAPAVHAGASLVVNAGFFSIGGAPEGLAVSGGRELSPFWRGLGGGVVTIAGGRAALHDTESWTPPPGLDFAIQCRPRLVVDRAVNIRRDTGERADRTALCIREGGRRLDVYVARTDSSNGMRGPTLFALATRLAAEGCEQALNLDGGPSTAAAWREGRERRLLQPRGPVRHWIALRPHSVAE